MIHHLKTHSIPFQAVRDGKKRFEFRKNDRDFHCGDTLILQEFNSFHTGEEHMALVTFIIYGPDYGVPEGYCVMSI